MGAAAVARGAHETAAAAHVRRGRRALPVLQLLAMPGGKGPEGTVGLADTDRMHGPDPAARHRPSQQGCD